MYTVLQDLLQPAVLIQFALGLTLIYLIVRHIGPRRRLWFFAFLFLMQMVLSTAAAGYLLDGSLEWQNPPLANRPEDVGAIVLLGGYVKDVDAVRPMPELDGVGALRTIHAANVYRQGKPCLLLVTGGKQDPENEGVTPADGMAELLRKLGVPDRDLVLETNSRNTYENAVESSKILQERGVKRIVLVTDARHMVRGAACFRKQGFDVVPSGCDYRATTWRTSISVFLPDGNGLAALQDVTHEWAGLVWYRFHGRI
jgi:uncharacterized SAM-binding protein YcdF (DUF218 family)